MLTENAMYQNILYMCYIVTIYIKEPNQHMAICVKELHIYHSFHTFYMAKYRLHDLTMPLVYYHVIKGLRKFLIAKLKHQH